MSAFTAINLEKLPAPVIVERLAFEVILAEVKAWLIERMPELAPVLDLESEPMMKVLEAWAYREALLRAEFDDAGRGNMLAFATGARLDHLGALFGVERAIVQEADPDAIPPVAEILEADARFRQRVQLSLEGFSTAGPLGSYVFWGMSASADVKDIGVASPTPGQVLITVLSAIGDGEPDAGLIATVQTALNADEVRPLTDEVIVEPATIVTYDLEAALTLYQGPDAEVVRSAAAAAVQAYVEEHHHLGHDITISGLHAALHQAGVQNVALASPAADIVIADDEAAFCSSVTVTVAGHDV